MRFGSYKSVLVVLITIYFIVSRRSTAARRIAPRYSTVLTLFKLLQVDEPQTWNNRFSEESGWSGINLLLMAGLYNVWQDDDTIIYSYSVITMESNHTLSWLHHRMPAILNTQEQIEVRSIFRL